MLSVTTGHRLFLFIDKTHILQFLSYNIGEEHRMIGGIIMAENLTYIRCGDYYIPDWKLPEEHRPIGRWGRMHRDYLKEHRPVVFNQLVLSGNLWTYLADINDQAQQRMEVLVKQMMVAEHINEDLKESNSMTWAQLLNNIHARADEYILNDLIFA